MPTIKQKLALKKITEEHRSVSRAMLEVGYDPDTASKPSNLTKSKGWKELMDEYLPDAKLAQVHQEGLEATKVISAKIVGMNANEQTDDFIDVPDYQTRAKYLELGYKIKGRMNDNTVQIANVSGEMGISFISAESKE